MQRETVPFSVLTVKPRFSVSVPFPCSPLYAFVAATEEEVRLGIDEGRTLLSELSDLDDDVGLAQGWTVIEYLHVLVGEMANHAEAQNRSFVHAERTGRLREQIQAVQQEY